MKFREPKSSSKIMNQRQVVPLPYEIKTFDIFFIQEDLLFYSQISFYEYICLRTSKSSSVRF